MREGRGAEEVGEGLGLLHGTTHRLHEGTMYMAIKHKEGGAWERG